MSTIPILKWQLATQLSISLPPYFQSINQIPSFGPLLIIKIINRRTPQPLTILFYKVAHHRSVPTLRRRPLDLAPDLLHPGNRAPGPQPLGQFDDAEPYHARIEPEGATHGGLRGGGGVEAHDEVVPGVVVGLMRFCRLGQQEGAPVGEAADDAARAQDQAAGVAGDSGGGERVLVGGREIGGWTVGGDGIEGGRWWVLFYSLTSLTLPGRTCGDGIISCFC